MVQQLEVGKKYHGFSLQKSQYVEELNGTCLIFEHVQSGAHLFKIVTPDDNKFFSITFKTLPHSDNGIPHIFEHSVLNGSKKFPVKSPFDILVKGSLNTFLNAMTMADRTLFPLSSRNEKDFYNLMDVYLDAVFHPNLYSDARILKQEGWHYELSGKDAPLTINGVVYNEMKGAFSAPQALLGSYLSKMMLPDTVYYWEAGGFPASIPELTQEEFIEFHRKYYHPVNSYIFLYGDGDLMKELAFINDNYLSEFKRIPFNAKIEKQQPFTTSKEMTVPYPILEQDELDNKTFLTLAYVVSDQVDVELEMAFNILEQILNSPGAPLREALLKSGLAKDVTIGYSGYILQPMFIISLDGANKSAKDTFREIVKTKLQEIVKEGIDKKLIEGIINITEFRFREADFQGFSKGMVYNFISLAGWINYNNPIPYLTYEKSLKAMKKAKETNFFEELIEKYILNNSFNGLLILEPEKGLEEKKEKEHAEKLAEYKNSISEDEIEKIIQETKELKEYQLTPDSPEAIDSIPMLSLSDINPKQELLELEARTIEGKTTLFHPDLTNKIVYLSLYFDSRSLPQHLIQYGTLFSNLLGDLNTKNYSYSELNTEIRLHTGGIDSFIGLVVKESDVSKYVPNFCIAAKAVGSKVNKLIELLSELLTNTQFDDFERIHEVIKKLRAQAEASLGFNGDSYALITLKSNICSMGKYKELNEGISYYKFLLDIDSHFNEKKDEIVANLKETAAKLFTQNNVLIGITSSKREYLIVEKAIPQLLSALKPTPFSIEKYVFPEKYFNEGLLSSSAVQYVAQGFNFKSLGYKFNGKMKVLKQILSSEYLHNQIRVVGGAYGAFAEFNNYGSAYLISYRDPHLMDTLKQFERVVPYLENFSVSDKEMTRFIIGTISGFDYPMTPSVKGNRAILNHLAGLSHENFQKVRTEILNTTQRDIRNFAAMVNDILKQKRISVFGNEEHIKKYRNLFDKLINVMGEGN